MTHHVVHVEIDSPDFDATRIQQLAHYFVADLRDQLQTTVTATIVQDQAEPRPV